MIARLSHLAEVESLLESVPCVAILGARQVGKTTLAAEVAERWDGPTHRFDLERSADVARLAEPELALEPLEGLIVIDEIQRVPDLFPALRVFVDRHADRRILVLGSASPDLLRQSSETLGHPPVGRTPHIGGVHVQQEEASAGEAVEVPAGVPS